MSEQPIETERRSRARERYERRQARRKNRQQGRPTTTTRQAAPLDTSNLPRLDMKYVRPLVLVIAAGAFMLALILGVGLFKDDPVLPDPNALWIGQDWTYAAPTTERLTSLIQRVDENRIGTVYARVSELNFDGTWTGDPQQANQFAEVEDAVSGFASAFKAQAPDTTLLGTISVRVDIGQDDGYRLDNPTIQRVVAEFSARVVGGLGFDGVFLVVEPIWADNSDDFLDLLRMVRTSIGDDAILAVAVPPDWTPEDPEVPSTALIAPGTVWPREFKQRIALVGVDQIVVQAYNSYLTDEDDYIAWMAYQVASYAEAIGDLETGTEVLIGLPTYDSLPPAHDARIENVPAAIAGVRQGIAQAGDFGTTIRGLAIYAEWETDEIEWEQYRVNWLRE
jgi:hypothetical protein